MDRVPLWPDQVQAPTVSASLFRVPRRAVLSLRYPKCKWKQEQPTHWARETDPLQREKKTHKCLSPYRHGSELEAYFLTSLRLRE